jgi:Mrp family chromosome partitioning ATPase
MNPTQSPPAVVVDQLHSVARVARRAARHWRAGIAVLLVGMAATAAFAALGPKRYRSEAVLHYREGLQWSSGEGMSARRIGQRLKDSLLARAQLAKLVQDLGLHPELVQSGRLADAVEEMRLATTFRLTDGDAFVVSYTGRSPGEAQRVTKALTELLIGENARLRAEQAEVATAFLDAEKRRNELELAAKESEQLRFLAKHPEFAHDQATLGASLRAQRRARAETAPAATGDPALDALRREEQRLRRQIASPAPVAVADPALVAARDEAAAKLKAAERELADRSGRFTDEHPDVRAAAILVRDAKAAYERAAAAAASAQAAAEEPAPAAPLEQRLKEVEEEIAARPRHRGRQGGAHADGHDAAQRIVALETEWARLNREVTEARERFQQLDSRQFVAAMTASSLVSGQAAQIVVVDPAFLPAQPVGMALKRLMALGALLSLGLALGLAALLGAVDDRLYDREDVDRLELAPVLLDLPGSWTGAATAPGPAPPPSGRGARAPAARQTVEALQVASREPRVAGPVPAAGLPGATQLARRLSPVREAAVDTRLLHAAAPAATPDAVLVVRVPTERVDPRVAMVCAPDSPVAASFRVLGQRIAATERARTLVVTSPGVGEGKTTCAVDLALALAEDGRARVLLVEGNLDAPSVARTLGFEPPVCFRAQLEVPRCGRRPRWIVSESLTPWLHAAVVDPGEEGPRPRIDGAALGLCLEDLRRAGYDHVVVDGPRVLGSAEVNLLQEAADGILMVVRAGQTRARDLRKAVEQVGGGKLLGLALIGPAQR